MEKNIVLDISWENYQKLHDLAGKYGTKLTSIKEMEFSLFFNFKEIEGNRLSYTFTIGYDGCNDNSIDDLENDVDELKEKIEELLAEYEELEDDPDSGNFDTEEEYQEKLDDLVFDIFGYEFQILIYEKVIEERSR